MTILLEICNVNDFPSKMRSNYLVLKQTAPEAAAVTVSQGKAGIWASRALLHKADVMLMHEMRD